MLYMKIKIVLRVSSHKKIFVFNFASMRWWMLIKFTGITISWYIYISQVIMLYTLNLQMLCINYISIKLEEKNLKQN